MPCSVMTSLSIIRHLGVSGESGVFGEKRGLFLRGIVEHYDRMSQFAG